MEDTMKIPAILFFAVMLLATAGHAQAQTTPNPSNQPPPCPPGATCTPRTTTPPATPPPATSRPATPPATQPMVTAPPERGGSGY
jgi:hypothetical protein